MGLRFVIHKLAASSLHFDFRLEIDGVLKSWALTRDPADNGVPRRLAVHTEDHPLEYADFEGDIWDRGTWIPEGSALAGLRRGTLEFELKGKRITGRWALVRMGNASTGKRDLWLLVKRNAAGDAKAPRAASSRAKPPREGVARR